MCAYSATFNNPLYNKTAGASGKTGTVPVANFHMEGDFNTVSMAVMYIKSDVMAIYGDETDDVNNPCQLNSTVIFTDGDITWWRGYVIKKPKYQNFASGRYLEVLIYGWDGILLNALAKKDGADVWQMATDSILCTRYALVATSVFGTFQGDTLWPDPTDVAAVDCWIRDADSKDDTLKVSIGIGTYVISAVNTGTQTFSTLSNVEPEFDFNNSEGSPVDARMTVDTGANAGIYTIVSATWTGAVTNIIVNEVIPSAAVAGNIINKSIIVGSTFVNFVPRGWMKIQNEWLYYDGYDDADGDTYYRLRNVIRGVFGTVAAAHVATTAAYEKLCKMIAPGAIKLEHDPVGADPWTTLRNEKEFAVIPEEGCFVLPEAATGAYRVTYRVYDEDRVLSLPAVAYVLTVSEIITSMMTEPATNGGPGFVAGDLTFDAIDIRINRYEYDPEERPVYVFDAIQDLLASIDLGNELKFWFSHGDGKFKLEIIANDAPTISVPKISAIEDDDGLDGVNSAVRVRYTDDQPLNRVSETYSHYQVSGGGGTSPDSYRAVSAGGESFEYGTGATYLLAGNSGMNFVADGKPGTKLGAIFDHDPAGAIEFGHWYFGAGVTPPTINLDRVNIKINKYRVIDTHQPHQNDQKSYLVRLQGCNDYNATTHAGTWFDLGCEIEGSPELNGRWVEATFTQFIDRSVNAVRVLWDYMAGTKDGPNHYAWIHDLVIEGDTVKYVYVQTTDREDLIGNVSYVYAPDSHIKLRGGVKSAGTDGCPRAYHHEVGATTRSAALSIGRTMLKIRLTRHKMKGYDYDFILPAKPELGITISVDEDGDSVYDYTGVIHSYRVSLTADGQRTSGTVMNHSAAVIE